MNGENGHYSVLLEETVGALDVRENGVYLDCTLGGAGHAERLLQTNGSCRLIGIDRDDFALSKAAARLSPFGDRVSLLRGNFADAAALLSGAGIDRIDGAIADLGVSSFQLDDASRGFSYMHDAPLDMRMDRSETLSARDVVNGYAEEDLARVIADYGEERFASRIARSIAAAREKALIETTGELADIVKSAIPAKFRDEKQHPAKRTFQAIRIEVNGELTAVKSMIDGLFPSLSPGGRMAIITFHSLEDRIVKQAFAAFAKGCTCPPDFPVCVCGKKPVGKVIARKPILPSVKELAENPRSRSAKLRVCEKL